MTARVCVLTARGRGAIGSIALYGQGAGRMLAEVFRTAEGKKVDKFAAGRIYHGTLMNGAESVDEVVVGCEREDFFAVCGHGNPILLGRIAGLFAEMGAEAQTAEEMLKQRLPAENMIEAEAHIERLKSATVEGVKIIQAQISGGLIAAVKDWLEGFERIGAEEIRRQCGDILRSSVIANRIIKGVRIVIAGPVNSGKSTLFNYYAGRAEAITAGQAGTTRDWVSVAVKIGPLSAELIDTAGLGELEAGGNADAEAQRRARELVRDADVVLFVTDGTGQPGRRVEIESDAPVIAVLNKSDLAAEPAARQVGGRFAEAVKISARTGEGIEDLNGAILRALGAADFCLSGPACFTQRQEEIVKQITEALQAEVMKDLIRQLLKGDGSV